MPAHRKAVPSSVGQWTVLQSTPRMDNGSLMYECLCSCGTRRWISSTALRRGATTMCASCAASVTKHGEAKVGAVTAEYRAWKEMQARCYSESHPKRAHYGGRGIVVCEEWRGVHGFESFLAHVGRRPDSKHSLDRIDVDGNYEPSNVRWATATQQVRNRRDNRRLTIDGRTALLVEWAEKAGVPAKRVWGRLIRGWSDNEAVFGRSA